jgi:nitrate/nitrite-specific signal transduction histidine kinase
MTVGMFAVQDDGAGFDPSVTIGSDRGRHLGLRIMRERAESVGGDVTISSLPGGGTRVHARVPVGAIPAAPRARLKEDHVDGATAAVTR